MAFSARFFFSSSILLFSLLVIASAAGDYEYVPKPDYSYSSTPKPESVKPDVVKPDNEYSPKPKPDVVKPSSDYSPQPKTDTMKPEYEYSPKPKPDNVKPEDDYNSKPKPDNAKHDDEYSPKSKQDDVKPEYGYGPKPKPDVVKPKDDYSPAQTETVKSDDGYTSKPKSDKVELEGYGSKSKSDEEDEYSPKPNFDKVTIPKPDYGYLPKPDTVKPDNYGYGQKLENPLAIGIEGLVLCKSGSTYVPVEGAVARITCEALDKNGYKTTPFSCLSGVTDAKGYFFKLLSGIGLDHDNIELTDCKVKVEKSPLKNCNVPTDVNKGITGALFSSYRILHDKKIKLYSVGPFFYTSELKSITTPTTGY